MSFFNDNQNFIRIKLQNDLRGMTLDQRKETYFRLQEETRNRVVISCQKSLLLSDRIRNFKDLFEVLGEFEFDYLLLAVFFDPDAEKIILDIGSHIIKFKPNGYIDKFSLVSMVNFNIANVNKGGMRAYLISFFIEVLKKPSLELDSKESGRNDFFTTLCQWLEGDMKSSQNSTEMNAVLIHFCKTWQVLYSKPFDQLKGVVLLHGLIALIRKVSQEEAEKLFKSLNICKSMLQTPLIMMVMPPFWDEEEFRRSDNQQILQGYKTKLSEFKELYLNSKYGTDPLAKNIFLNDFLSYYKSNKLVQEKLSATIFTNISNGNLPSESELELLEKLSLKVKSEEGLDSQKLRLEVFRRTYSLENLKLKSRW